MSHSDRRARQKETAKFHPTTQASSTRQSLFSIMFISKANQLIRSREYSSALDILHQAIEANGAFSIYEDKIKEILRLAPELKSSFLSTEVATLEPIHNGGGAEPEINRQSWLDNFFGFAGERPAEDTDHRATTPDDHIRQIKTGCSPCAVIPSYNDYKVLKPCVDSLLLHAGNILSGIVVSDDYSTDSNHASYLNELEEYGEQYRIPVYVCRALQNGGFSANVNRGVKKAQALLTRPDILLLNSDTEVTHDAVQRMALVSRTNMAITGARLLYPDGSIQHGGGFRNFNNLEWFDHLFRAFPSTDLRTTCITSRLYCTGAALYIPSEAFARIGYFDEAFKMGYEDVDYCLRAWDCRVSTIYAGNADIKHHESKTRGLELGERERVSKDFFWVKHKDRFGKRSVDNGDGLINVIFVLQDTGVGGGHRVVFMFANELARSGFRVSFFSLASAPSWFELDPSIEFRMFPDYNELTISLAPLNAIKVATWWETAAPVWEASIKNGIPVWLSQDIESSYYKEFAQKINVLSSYKPEFVYVVNYKWIQAVYQTKFYYHSHYVGLGVDHHNFFPDPEVRRERKSILFCARSEPLKGFSLTRECIPALLAAGYKVMAFGSEPGMVEEWSEIEFHFKPSDTDLRKLYSRAEIFLQTSVHEGFSLPPLEAMACGAIAVMTDATGNMDFARHMQNCMIIDRSVGSLMNALRVLSFDDELRRGMGEESFNTVLEYHWEKPLSRLISLFTAISKTPVYGKQLYDF